MSVVIRAYQERDRQELLACIQHLQEHERSLEPELKTSGESVATSFLDFFVTEDAQSKGKLFVAELDGKIVGFVNGYVDEDPEADDLVTRRWFYLSDIAVLPEYKGQSIGSQLILAMEQYVKSLNISQIKLDVLSKNASARAFYAKHGYRDYQQIVLKKLS